MFGMDFVLQEYRDNEINARQKRKVVVFVQEAKTAKALCTSLGQHRRMYKAMKKGFVKKYDRILSIYFSFSKLPTWFQFDFFQNI